MKIPFTIPNYLRFLIMSVTTPVTIHVLKKKQCTCLNVAKCVDLAYNLHKNLIPFLGRVLLSIEPCQVRSELLSLLNILMQIKPKRILEIGTAMGGTLFCFSRVASEDATIISIDLPGGPFGGGYPYLRTFLYRSFALGNQRVILFRKDSHKTETLSEVKKILKGEMLDFLFIDGDHSYCGVRRDFELYRNLVRKSGMIAFHDICPGPRRNVGGVPTFWSEVKKYFKHEEIVRDWKQGGCGIGVIYIQ